MNPTRRQKPKTTDDLFLETRLRAIRDGKLTAFRIGNKFCGSFSAQGDFSEPPAERLHTTLAARIRDAFNDRRVYHPLPRCVSAYLQGRAA